MKKIFLFLFIVIFVSGCHFGESEFLEEKLLKESKPTCNDVGENSSSSVNISPKQKVQKINRDSFDNLIGKYAGAIIKTNMGDIKIKFYENDAPTTVNNFLNLAQNDFYDGIKFHRVIKDFMIQAGDPNSRDDDWSDDGMGGPGYKFQDEFNNHKLVRGSVAMANSGPNTNGSQFFIVTANATPWLDGRHTNFGYVTEGMDTVDKIGAVEVDTAKNNHPLKDVVIKDIELIKK